MSTNTKWGLAFATLALVAVCAIILVSRQNEPAGAPGYAAPGYSMDQYGQLQTGMGIDEVDAVMGGGGSATTSEIGGQTLDIYMYMNDDGSNVTVSFVEGSLTSKAAAGF